MQSNNKKNTFKNTFLITLTLRTLIPALVSPRACLLRSSVTVEIAFNPAFSAKIEGITSNASANALEKNITYNYFK